MTDEVLDPLAAFRAAISACTACSARASARAPVPFAFPLGAEDPPPVLVVARNPGRHEDVSGQPFVGPSGARLDEFLKVAGLHREFDVIVTSAVKCATVGRAPTQDEFAVCTSRFLRNEVRLFRPRMVIGFGREVHRALTGKAEWEPGEIRDLPGRAATLYTFHPDFTLRSPKARNAFFRHAEDLRRWLSERSLIRE